ncbi:MAG: hypothetical protein IJ048_00635 [Clostridia bacterium]|nr:hypothetical protein [Clostridia bacterium]
MNATYISLAAVLISLLGLLLNSRKESRTDAASAARMETKLDSVANGVDDIRVEIRTMRDTVSDHGERLAKVEARASSNTHRLDALEGRSHPPDKAN